jgi:O-methyltransferase
MVHKYIAFLKIGLISPELFALTWKIKRSKRTYLGYPQLLSLAESYLKVKDRTQGALQVAEFGVGRGGSATFLAWLVGKHGGTLTLFDLFGRIPSPTEKDGDRAQDRYQFILEGEGKEYYGNMDNIKDVILKDIGEVCSLEKVEVVEGKYEDTLIHQEKKTAFNLVHIDCDWYESSKAVYRYLKSNLAPGAIVQVDDFSNWEGSRSATLEADWLVGRARKKIVGGALVIDTSAT